MQPFVASESAPFNRTRSQEPPSRLTRDIGAPTITRSSSAPSAISTSTHCNGFDVLVTCPLGDATGGPLSKSSESFTVIPQEDGISVSESSAIERLDTAPSSSIGPASNCSQNSVFLQSTADTSQNLISTLLVLPPPTPNPVFGLQEAILVTDGAQEARKDGNSLSIDPMDVLREQTALYGDLEGDSALPSAAKGSPGYKPVASAAVIPSIEVTLPIDHHGSLRISLESPSTPCTPETKAFIETQGPPVSVSLEPPLGNSTEPLNSVHSISAGRNRPKHKLASPFRSPLKSKKIRDENLPPSSPTADSTTAKRDNTGRQPLGQFLLPPFPLKKPEFTPASNVKDKSTRAAKSTYKLPTFKSPLRASPVNPTSQSLFTYPPSSAHKKTASRPIWTPSDNRPATALTIQTLERRLTLLERAIKIRSEHEGEESLEDLTRKWKEVARDVSWELWAIVKQNHEDGVGGIVNAGEECGLFTKPSDGNGFGGRFRSEWGWDDKGRGESSSDWNTECGKEERPQDGDVEKDEEPENGLTMSVMLRQLGIAESTLGWEEAEGDFKAD